MIFDALAVLAAAPLVLVLAWWALVALTERADAPPMPDTWTGTPAIRDHLRTCPRPTYAWHTIARDGRFVCGVGRKPSTPGER